MTAADADRAKAAEVRDWNVAVGIRPHYAPCDFPDHACSCGAAEDRYAIAAALAEARAPYDRLTADLLALAEELQGTAEITGGKVNGYVFASALRAVAAATRGAIR